ncbi:MAG: lysophospholipid acyltransferase family protein [Chlamydiae bacterium]|nr:lysophospholipid acyltransferase family protein [Chlamydiota bacterium]MBI3266718.1 lysophospholipid acyltransferase family protein [Chlamydiota bacterium]
MLLAVLYHILRWIVNVFPFSWGMKLFSASFAFGYWFCPQRRRIIEENLSVILPNTNLEKNVKEVFAFFGRYLALFLSSTKRKENLRRMTRTQGLENLIRPYQGGRGVIALTAHLGNWEMGAYLVVREGMKVSAVFMNHDNDRANRLFIAQRDVPGLTVIPWGDHATSKCLEALKAGHVLAIAGDIDFLGNGMEVNLFGKRVRIPKGPIVLAKRRGVPIVPGGYVWTDSGGLFFFENPILSEGLSEEMLASRVAGALEKMIRKYPTQWLCFERMWKIKNPKSKNQNDSLQESF